MLSDRGIERLCQGFDELDQLKNLSLNFSWYLFSYKLQLKSFED